MTKKKDTPIFGDIRHHLKTVIRRNRSYLQKVADDAERAALHKKPKTDGQSDEN